LTDQEGKSQEYQEMRVNGNTSLGVPAMALYVEQAAECMAFATEATTGRKLKARFPN
jgi:hypothetical protein